MLQSKIQLMKFKKEELADQLRRETLRAESAERASAKQATTISALQEELKVTRLTRDSYQKDARDQAHKNAKLTARIWEFNRKNFLGRLLSLEV